MTEPVNPAPRVAMLPMKQRAPLKQALPGEVAFHPRENLSSTASEAQPCSGNFRLSRSSFFSLGIEKQAHEETMSAHSPSTCRVQEALMDVRRDIRCLSCRAPFF
jgi:hypothetical protein